MTRTIFGRNGLWWWRAEWIWMVRIQIFDVLVGSSRFPFRIFRSTGEDRIIIWYYGWWWNSRITPMRISFLVRQPSSATTIKPLSWLMSDLGLIFHVCWSGLVVVLESIKPMTDVFSFRLGGAFSRWKASMGITKWRDGPFQGHFKGDHRMNKGHFFNQIPTGCHNAISMSFLSRTHKHFAQQIDAFSINDAFPQWRQNYTCFRLRRPETIPIHSGIKKIHVENLFVRLFSHRHPLSINRNETIPQFIRNIRIHSKEIPCVEQQIPSQRWRRRNDMRNVLNPWFSKGNDEVRFQ